MKFNKAYNKFMIREYHFYYFLIFLLSKNYINGKFLLFIIRKKKGKITLIICLLIINLFPHMINLNRSTSFNDYHLDF